MKRGTTPARFRLIIAAALIAGGAIVIWQASGGLGWTLGSAVLVLGCLMVIGRRDQGALWRWDHFLPFLNKRWRRSRPETALLQGLRRCLPSRWFFDEETGRDGAIRRWCRKLGPSVLAAPWRRMVQTFCFLLFLGLFFVVCWPYGARPVVEGESSEGWSMVRMDPVSGQLTVNWANESEPPWLGGSDVIYLSQAGEDAGRARVLERSDEGWVLQPDDVSRFLVAQGDWVLSQTPIGQWPSHYAQHFAEREHVPVDVFLTIDPLVSLSTAIAAKSWVWSLTCAAIILLVCVLIPRGFCGYLCPLGTLIDLFDWAVSKRVKRFRVPASGWWVHVKYYLLVAVLVAALGGVLLSGVVAAIPVITRGLLFVGEPVQSGFLRGWHLVPAMNLGQFLSIGLFLGVLLLGLLKPRFWCRYVCPSGALFSLGNVFRVSERKVDSSCIHCNKCVAICPFDAIKPDFTTRSLDCTLCQSCGGVCPTHSIKFVERWNTSDLKLANDPPTGESRWGRRGFLSWAVGGGAAAVSGGLAVGASRRWGAGLDRADAYRPVRPPGSVPEEAFLQMCIRCGECYKVCPNNVLQPVGFEQGLEGLWTPQMVADWAGCEPSCNACGHVCPTGAILPLSMEQKKGTRMGLAVVNEETCLPFADREACQLCVDECRAAGYDAIEFTQVHTEVDASGAPIPGSGHLAPVVLADKCVGCGLCQTRCYGINAEQKGLLKETAILIEAGEGKEDRWQSLEQLAASKDGAATQANSSPGSAEPADSSDDPFGL